MEDIIPYMDTDSVHVVDLAKMSKCERQSFIEQRIRMAKEKRKQGHEVGKFMKHKRQAPWYRRSILARKNPNEKEEEKN